ncbi:MAG: hypothetical protein JSS32_05975 [Verrucomicrobia bacterium]|nr:hypothetical protein [Verrucomicrobiota bacterium]
MHQVVPDPAARRRESAEILEASIVLCHLSLAAVTIAKTAEITNKWGWSPFVERLGVLGITTCVAMQRYSIINVGDRRIQDLRNFSARIIRDVALPIFLSILLTRDDSFCMLFGTMSGVMTVNNLLSLR